MNTLKIPVLRPSQNRGMSTVSEFTNLFSFIAEQNLSHSRDSEFYRFVEPLVRNFFRGIQDQFSAPQPIPFGEYGALVLPYVKLGSAVDSLDLLGLDELIIFAFYYRNRERYRRALDIGANIGLHSIVLSKCGFSVEAYEPDPTHFHQLQMNLDFNNIKNNCCTHQAAVSNTNGDMEFVRVLGNTTSSHLAGAKAQPYGELERFSVEVRDISKISNGIDLAKIDAEGHEDVIIRAIPFATWQSLDVIAEIGTSKIASSLYQHFASSPVNIFSQKIGWQKVDREEDMPTSYREGSVFFSQKIRMNW